MIASQIDFVHKDLQNARESDVRVVPRLCTLDHLQ